MRAEAWVKRDVEREGLLRLLVQKVYDFEAKRDEQSSSSGYNKALFFDLSVALLFILRERHEKDIVEDQGIETDKRGFKSLSSPFLDVLLPCIKDFARSPAEETFLLEQFLEKMLTPIKALADSGLRREEMSDPKKIFQAPSAMTEVEWEG